MKKKSILRINLFRLSALSILVGVISSGVALSLKKLTEHLEENVISWVSQFQFAVIFIPVVGIATIYLLRNRLFNGESNKGIKEIYHTINYQKIKMPLSKLPSHFLNGLLTVISGGSTGIEVSTVVASAAVGAKAYQEGAVANRMKTEIICAAVAAGIATLFNSPLAGVLFAIEVVARRLSVTIAVSCISAILLPTIYLSHYEQEMLLDIPVFSWKIQALPYFLMLGLLAATVSSYFTRIVVYTKKQFLSIKSDFLRVSIGGTALGILLLVLPQLFGDSYHSLPTLIDGAKLYSVDHVLLLSTLILIKPLAASLTLGAGGDGGVFAPSIVVGALLGVLVATVCNHFFHVDLVVINFALAGAAAALSSAIHAPLTSLFIVCNLAPGGFILFWPLLLCCFLARYTAQWICSYTVYTYDDLSSQLFPHQKHLARFLSNRYCSR